LPQFCQKVCFLFCSSSGVERCTTLILCDELNSLYFFGLVANWFFIYRKPSFNTLCSNIEKEQDKLEKWKLDNLDGANQKKDKKIKIKARPSLSKQLSCATI